jgi:hypothetical protein
MATLQGMSETQFTKLDWRPSKRRATYVRERRFNGQKQAPPAFLAAGKLNGIGSGKHRICAAKRRDGEPCHTIAMRDVPYCRLHGGASQTSRSIRPYVRKDGVVTVPRHAETNPQEP